jgi:hypothetical protein
MPALEQFGFCGLGITLTSIFGVSFEQAWQSLVQAALENIQVTSLAARR